MGSADLHMQKKLFIQYGNRRIFFERIPRSSNSSKVLIKVHPDQRVVAHAPVQESDDAVLIAVNKRARWLWIQINKFSTHQQHVFPRKYVSGESHYYLGKQYLLKVIIDSSANPQVKLLRGRLEVTLRQRSSEKVRKLLKKWYREKARDVFHRRLEEMVSKTLWLKELPNIRLLAMKTQWGSCSPHGTLTLNPHLIKAPRECIDYVLLHELCHIAEHNHSERFYRLMNQIMPKWERTKEKLDDMAAILLNT